MFSGEISQFLASPRGRTRSLENNNMTYGRYRNHFPGCTYSFAIYDSVTPVELNGLILLINPSALNRAVNVHRSEYMMNLR